MNYDSSESLSNRQLPISIFGQEWFLLKTRNGGWLLFAFDFHSPSTRHLIWNNGVDTPYYAFSNNSIGKIDGAW